MAVLGGEEFGERVHLELGFAGKPIVGDFADDGRDEAEEGVWVWEESGDVGSAADLLVEVFEEVGGAEAGAVFGREEEDGEAFGGIGLEPGGERRCGGLMLLGEGADFGVGFCAGA